MARLAEVYYKEAGIEKRIFSSTQIYPYGILEDLLDKGTIDIGFFYKHENFWNSTGNQKFITLSPYVDMSDMSLNTYYAKVNVLYFSLTCIFWTWKKWHVTQH